MALRRLERINDLLRTELSEVIHRSLKDPRVGGLVSITQVETSADLRHARVYVSVFGSDDERASSMQALRSAAGFIRHEVAQRVILRHMPELEFLIDSSIERGDRILRLIKEAVATEAPRPARRPRRRTATTEPADG